MGGGLGQAALLSLLGRDVPGAMAEVAYGAAPGQVFDLKPRRPHFEPKAKAVIHLFMNGGPSQVDLFDPKQELTRNHGKSYFNKIAGEVENPHSAGALLRSPFKFAQHGQSGMWVSEAMPYFAQCVDEVVMIRSMFTASITHEPALFNIHSGRLFSGHPTLGAWISYGLGSENQSLPAYVVLEDPKGPPINRNQNWQSGYLPPVCQGTRFRSTGAPVLDLHPGKDIPDQVIDLERDLIGMLDRIHQRRRPHQPRLGARIANYELAARMQIEASEALDLSRESPATQAMYGIGEDKTDSYGRRCLIARRLVERGVRFVQLFIDGQIWDNHTKLKSGLRSACERTDKPVAALLTDLRQSGLLEEVVVAWGGEMGRLPIAQLDDKKNEANSGRDHNKNAMIGWMAGAGLKRGYVHGATDEIGLKAVEKTVGVPEWHATLLHLLGLDYARLFVRQNGLDERLVGVHEPDIVSDLLA
jgi:hypothetical protein